MTMKLGSKYDLIDTPRKLKYRFTEVMKALRGLDYTKYALSTTVY